jgi:MFS family permease
MEKKAVNVFILLKVIEAATLAVISTTYVPFLLERGLTLFQCNQVNIAFMFVNTVLDPLTGSLADKIGQKRIYLTGFLFLAIGLFVYGLGHNFWAFIVAESIIAVGTAFWSEALESWFRSLYGKKLCHEVVAKVGIYPRIFSIVLASVGSVAAANYGLEIPWFMGCLFAVLGFVAGVFMLAKFPETTNHHELPKGSIAASFRLIKNTPQLQFTLVVVCVASIAFQAFNMFWTPVFKELTGSVAWLGFIWAGASGGMVLGSFVIRKVVLPSKKTVALLVFLIGLPLLISSLFFSGNLWVMLIGFVLHEIPRACLGPTIFTYSNDYIPDEIRATTNSIKESSRTIGAVVGLFLSGLLTNEESAKTIGAIVGFFIPGLFINDISPVQVWVLSAGLLLVLSVWILASKKE